MSLKLITDLINTITIIDTKTKVFSTSSISALLLTVGNKQHSESW